MLRRRELVSAPMPPDTNETSDREHSFVALRSSTGALLITATVLASLVGFLDA
jgi:hypothetical protein